MYKISFHISFSCHGLDLLNYLDIDLHLNVSLHKLSKGKVHPITGHESPDGEKRYSSNLSLTSVLDGMDGQRHTPAALPPGKTNVTPYLCGWVGPRFGLDGCGKSRQHRVSIPGSSSP